MPGEHRLEIDRLLAEGKVVFGIFPGEQSRAGGVARGSADVDFVFYSLERLPFDIQGLQSFMVGMREGAGAEPPPPLMLRVPPIGQDVEAAAKRVALALQAGVGGIVFPHARSREEALAASRMAPAKAISMLIVEDVVGVESVEEIAAVQGIDAIFAGPGDLRRAYAGDSVLVEEAIQRILAACRRHGAPCGITASQNDIARRIEEGFRIFIVQDPATVRAGREAVGSSSPP